MELEFDPILSSKIVAPFFGSRKYLSVRYRRLNDKFWFDWLHKMCLKSIDNDIN